MSASSPAKDIDLKIVLIGESGVGAKTCLLNRFVFDRFVEEDGRPFPATIACATFSADVTVDDFVFHLDLWGLRLQFIFHSAQFCVA